jgi:hypothetical protein
MIAAAIVAPGEIDQFAAHARRMRLLHASLARVRTRDTGGDEAIGEAAQLRYHSPVLQTAVNGLFAVTLRTACS